MCILDQAGAVMLHRNVKARIRSLSSMELAILHGFDHDRHREPCNPGVHSP
jgi:hypothetical protein